MKDLLEANPSPEPFATSGVYAYLAQLTIAYNDSYLTSHITALHSYKTKTQVTTGNLSILHQAETIVFSSLDEEDLHISTEANESLYNLSQTSEHQSDVTIDHVTQPQSSNTETPVVVGYFNNEATHSAPLALTAVTNTMLR